MLRPARPDNPDLKDVSGQHPRFQLDKAFYERVRFAERRLRDRSVIPPFSGRCFVLEAGQAVRIIQEEGPQVGVVAFWNADDPRESYGPMRTRAWEGLTVTTYTRLWSDLPWLRPMMTCVEDTVAPDSASDGFHHHRFWTHCSPESMEMRSGRPGLSSCRVNLLRAIEPFGMTEENLGDNVVVFQKARLDPGDGRWYCARSDSRPGDYVELYAEMDLLVAVSVCPSGDNTRGWSEPGDDSVLPLGVEVHDTGVTPGESYSWTDWRPGWKGRL